MSRWWVLTDDYPPCPGGVATWSALVAEALAAEGHEVRVLTRARPRLKEVRRRGLAVEAVRGPSFGRWGGTWAGASLLRRLRGGDQVLATTWPMATLLARWPGLPRPALHVVAHGSDVTRPARDPRARRRVLRGARWWAVSAFLAEIVEQLGAPCEVLPAPIDPLPSRGRDPSRRWVMIGRATELKGGDRAIRLAHAAGVVLDVVGGGEQLGRWRAVAASLGSATHFHGAVPREQALRILAGAELALLLPRLADDGTGAEGLGLALVEAAALGVPGVGVEVGGVPEALGPGLILEDPEDLEGSVRAIRDWLDPTRGPTARAWVASNHGTKRLVRVLTSRSNEGS